MKEWDNDKHEEALERRRWKRLDNFKYAVEQGKTNDNGKVVTLTQKAIRKNEDNCGSFADLLKEEMAQLEKAIKNS